MCYSGGSVGDHDVIIMLVLTLITHSSSFGCPWLIWPGSLLVGIDATAWKRREGGGRREEFEEISSVYDSPAYHVLIHPCRDMLVVVRRMCVSSMR